MRTQRLPVFGMKPPRNPQLRAPHHRSGLGGAPQPPPSLGNDMDCLLAFSGTPEFSARIGQILQGHVPPTPVDLQNLARQILAVPVFRTTREVNTAHLVLFKRQVRQVMEILIPAFLREEVGNFSPEIFCFRRLVETKATNAEENNLQCLQLNFIFLMALALTLSSGEAAQQLSKEFAFEQTNPDVETVEMACRGFVEQLARNPYNDFLGIFPCMRKKLVKPELEDFFGFFAFAQFLFARFVWGLRLLITNRKS